MNESIKDQNGRSDEGSGTNQRGTTPQKKESVMTTKTTTVKVSKIVEDAMEIAKIVTKDGMQNPETRRAARNFLKRNRDQREGLAPKFMANVATSNGLADDADAKEILAAVNGEPDSKPIQEPKKTAAKKTAAKKEEPETVPVEGPNKKFTEETGLSRNVRGDRPTATIRVKSVKEAIAQAEGRHLGDLCGWSLSGSKSKDEVEALAAKHDLADDLEFPKLTPNACYRKAISQVFATGKKSEKNWMAVVVENSADKMVHSIVGSSVVDDDDDTVSAKDAAFETEIKVGFDKKAFRDGASAAGCLVVEDEKHPAAIQLKEVYLELAETYLTNDIRNAFQAAFRKWDACPVLPHGGLWYIPAVHAKKVRSWNEFMIDLGMTTVVIPAFDTKETIASLQEATRSGLEGQLSDLLWMLDYYAEQGWAKTRTNTLEARIADFDELRNRAELYQNILGTTISDLTDKVKIAADRLTKDVTTRHEIEEKEAADAAAEKQAAKDEKAAEREEKKAAKEKAAKKAKADRKAAKAVA